VVGFTGRFCAGDAREEVCDRSAGEACTKCYRGPDYEACKDRRISKKSPMQLASFNQVEQRHAYGYASEPPPPGAAGIFEIFH
jgi:hypothetical protein